MAAPVLVIQMGHAGRTSGVTGAPGEQDFTQRVGDACHRLLSGKGWTIRTISADPPYADYKGQAFFAVHADGNNNPAVNGSSVGYQNNAGKTLAQDFKAFYIGFGWKGPWHQDNYTDNLHYYYGVGDAIDQGNTRACIVECGTITNPAEHDAMTSQEGIDRVAYAIGAALGMNVSPPHQEVEDMAGQYSRPLPASTVLEGGELETMSTVIPIDKGGAAGMTRVWITLVANGGGPQDVMEVPIAHWEIANGDGTTRIVPYFPTETVIKPAGYGMPPGPHYNEAPDGAVMLIVNHRSKYGGAACIAHR